MFEKDTNDGYNDPLPGIRQKTLVYGERTLMTEFVLTKDSILPDHAHPYEQTGYLVKGRILLKIGDEEFDTMPGNSWCKNYRGFRRHRSVLPRAGRLPAARGLIAMQTAFSNHWKNAQKIFQSLEES